MSSSMYITLPIHLWEKLLPTQTCIISNPKPIYFNQSNNQSTSPAIFQHNINYFRFGYANRLLQSFLSTESQNTCPNISEDCQQPVPEHQFHLQWPSYYDYPYKDSVIQCKTYSEGKLFALQHPLQSSILSQTSQCHLVPVINPLQPTQMYLWQAKASQINQKLCLKSLQQQYTASKVCTSDSE